MSPRPVCSTWNPVSKQKETKELFIHWFCKMSPFSIKEFMKHSTNSNKNSSVYSLVPVRLEHLHLLGTGCSWKLEKPHNVKPRKCLASYAAKGMWKSALFHSGKRPACVSLSYGELEKTIDSALLEFPLVLFPCTQLLTVTCRMNTSLLMNALLIFTFSAGPVGFGEGGGKKEVAGLT